MNRSIRRQLAALYRSCWRQRLYTELKFLILPFEQFSRYLPRTGALLEVGSGYGFVSNYLSLERPSQRIVGHDPALARVLDARVTVGERTNLTFLSGECKQFADGEFAGVVMIDVLHHAPYADQAQIVADVYDKLKPGGVLVVRETRKRWSVRYLLLNYWLEEILYCGRERSNFRKVGAWVRMLHRAGFLIGEVLYERWYDPYLWVTFICTRPVKGHDAHTASYHDPEFPGDVDELRVYAGKKVWSA